MTVSYELEKRMMIIFALFAISYAIRLVIHLLK
jgi:hypothetical protein